MNFVTQSYNQISNKEIATSFYKNPQGNFVYGDKQKGYTLAKLSEVVEQCRHAQTEDFQGLTHLLNNVRLLNDKIDAHNRKVQSAWFKFLRVISLGIFNPKIIDRLDHVAVEEQIKVKIVEKTRGLAASTKREVKVEMQGSFCYKFAPEFIKANSQIKEFAFPTEGKLTPELLTLFFQHLLIEKIKLTDLVVSAADVRGLSFEFHYPSLSESQDRTNLLYASKFEGKKQDPQKEDKEEHLKFGTNDFPFGLQKLKITINRA